MRGVDHPPSNAEVKERVELYLYSPSGPHRACKEINLPFFNEIYIYIYIYIYSLTQIYYIKKYLIKITYQLHVSTFMKPSSGCNIKGDFYIQLAKPYNYEIPFTFLD